MVNKKDMVCVNNESLYNARWDDWSDMKKFGPKSRWLRAMISSCLDYISSPIVSVLDMGCGEGTNTKLLYDRFKCNVTGCDISSSGIKNCRNHYGEIMGLTFLTNSELRPNAAFDLITCFEVLEHLEDWEEFLRCLLKRSNKYILLSFPTGRMRPFETAVGHVRNFRKGQVESFLSKYHVYPVKLKYAGYPFYSPIYRNLCNIINPTETQFATGTYGIKQRLISNILYTSFRYLSVQNNCGDAFCGLFDTSKCSLRETV